VSNWWIVDVIADGYFVFREPVRHRQNAIVGSRLVPMMSTVFGMLRTAVGNILGVDWSAYKERRLPEVESLIGTPNDPVPPFEVSYPMLVGRSDAEIVFIRVPHGLWFEKNKEGEWRVRLSDSFRNVGRIRYVSSVEDISVPDKVTAEERYHLDGSVKWIPVSVLQKAKPDEWVDVTKEMQVSVDAFFQLDSHTGVSIDPSTGTYRRVDDKDGGLLYRYSMVYVRGDSGYRFIVHGLPDEIMKKLDGLEVWLGGKGRRARLKVRMLSDVVELSGFGGHEGNYFFLYSPVEARIPPWDGIFDRKPDGLAMQGGYINAGFSYAYGSIKPTKVFMPEGSMFYYREVVSPKSGIFFIKR